MTIIIILIMTTTIIMIMIIILMIIIILLIIMGRLGDLELNWLFVLRGWGEHVSPRLQGFSRHALLFPDPNHISLEIHFRFTCVCVF